MKVTVDSIEFALFNMYMLCNRCYANHNLFEYLHINNEVSDICNNIYLSQYFVLGGEFNIDLTGDTPQGKSYPFIC